MARCPTRPTLRAAAHFAAMTAVAAALAGCATFEPKPAPDMPRAAEIGVYEAFPPIEHEYVLVKRLWGGPWRSAIAVPRYASVAAGAADLRNHAVLLGGDAVMNFACYHAAVDPNSAYYCNGNVIRYVR
ncbi:MAG: hypothetical protein ABI630_11565 [Betaproteobacteria bacterium]